MLFAFGSIVGFLTSQITQNQVNEMNEIKTDIDKVKTLHDAASSGRNYNGEINFGDVTDKERDAFIKEELESILGS